MGKGSDSRRLQLELAKSLPHYLTVTQARQIRDFVEAVLNVRVDEAIAGQHLESFLAKQTYVPYPWLKFLDGKSFLRYTFRARFIAKKYRSDPSGFREYICLPGTEHEVYYTDEELNEFFLEYTFFGYAQSWDQTIVEFAESLPAYFEQDEIELGSFTTAVEETLQLLCFPIFRTEFAQPFMDRWQLFSDSFKALEYEPRDASEFHLTDFVNSRYYANGWYHNE